MYFWDFIYISYPSSPSLKPDLVMTDKQNICRYCSWLRFPGNILSDQISDAMSDTSVSTNLHVNWKMGERLEQLFANSNYFCNSIWSTEINFHTFGSVYHQNKIKLKQLNWIKILGTTTTFLDYDPPAEYSPLPLLDTFLNNARDIFWKKIFLNICFNNNNMSVFDYKSWLSNKVIIISYSFNY